MTTDEAIDKLRYMIKHNPESLLVNCLVQLLHIKRVEPSLYPAAIKTYAIIAKAIASS